jgi:hypothetical protein
MKLLHGLVSYPGTPGHPCDRMKVFGYEGDVSGVDISTVAFSSQQLDITPDFIIPGSVAIFQHLISEEPNHETVGPFKSMDANVLTIKTPTMAYVPFELLEPLLGTDLTDRQVFELIVPALMEAELKDTFSRLIDFLTVALFQPTEERSEPYTLLPQVGAAGYVPGPEAISHRQETILHWYIPALRPALSRPTSSNPALLDVVRGMRDMVAEARAERTARSGNREEARRPHTIREKLGEAIVDHLLLIWGITNNDALPDIYHKWAARPPGLSER